MIRLDSSNTQCQGFDAREVAYQLGGARKCGRSWQALCPAHPDRHPSLTLTNKDGKLLFHCFSCSQESVLRALAERGLIPSHFGGDFQVVAAHLAHVDQAMKSAKWVGTAGATDYVVLGAHLQIARRVNKVQYRASCRELADLSNVNAATAWRSSRRLARDGWLAELHRTDLVDANRWELRVPR